MPARHAAALALLAFATAACSHKISSPSMAAGEVRPDLVCAEQLTTSVTLTGGGFTPMPTDTLRSASRLLLPSVVLTRTRDLGGAPTGGSVRIPDDPANPDASLVHWKSSQEMSFDVVPSLLLAPGFYDIRVTNPDEKASATFASGLAAVPRPVLSSLDRAAICDAQGAQTVSLTGTGILTVGAAVPTVTIGTRSNADFSSVVPTGCVELPGTFAEGVVSSCTGLTITIPAGLFPPGSYPVTVANPPPASCSSSDAVTLQVEPPPVVSGVVPVTICQGGGTLALGGTGFLPAATVGLFPLTAGPPALQSSSASVDGAGTLLTATFGGGAVPPNKYDVVVDNHDGCTDEVPHQQVTAVTGPVAFFADPEVVYDGIDTTVTVYVTTITGPISGVRVEITPHGLPTPRTSLAPIAVPGHPNRVQVVIPAGQPVGTYDLYLDDATLCPTILPNAIAVTATTSVTLKAVTPGFGWTGSTTAVTIQRDTAAAPPGDSPFVATPRLFLNPSGNTSVPAIQAQSVSYVDGNTLTAVLPSGQAAGAYDLVLVNPDGTVGILPSAFQVKASPPPLVAAATPSSIVDAAGQVVVATGSHFDDVAGTTAALACRDAAGNPVAPPPVATGTTTCATAQSCSVSVAVDGSLLPIGAVCVLRLTNNGDGSYFDYSAIGVTNPSLNLTTPVAGSPLTRGRRALVAAAGNATPASRFLYAVGGDGGAAAAAAPFDDVEVAPVDLFGRMGTWSTVPRSRLATPRAFAASATVGRYIYVFGGTDGTSTVGTAERAMILDPAEAPSLDVGDLLPAATGLDAGYWIYRVSAVFSASDLDNPGGESLPSDEVIVRVPSFPGKKIQVVLAWQAPRDSLGATLPGVAGYQVYRTPVVNGTSGEEVLLASVAGGATLQFTDDGTAAPGTQTPLPFGSLGRWALLPSLGTARRAHAGAAAFDPVSPGKLYVYALLGQGAGGSPLTSYEYLPVTVLANGHQVADPSWTPGGSTVAAGRSQLGAWVADSVTSARIAAPATYVYLGGGLESTDVDAGNVAAGGDLGAFVAQKKFGGTQAGYGVCAANGQLFSFGGASAAPSQGATSASIVDPAPTLAPNSWNSQGITLSSPRYLTGSAVQSAFIFLVGGQTGTGPAAGAGSTTELVIW
ncbi:MAG TPA: kelch repeat-containing protein [Anaeromyxobacteraceae bacterium]|nr:kelch repeat-containing protein [Anaeromyxobacteraceae bacterium]